MRAFLIAAAIVVGWCVVCSNPQRPTSDGGTLRYVAVESGLLLRERPDQTAARLDTIPFNAELHVTGEHSKPVTISGHMGPWRKVIWKGKAGWVFGPFVLPYRITVSLEKADSCCIAIQERLGNACIKDKCARVCGHDSESGDCAHCQETCPNPREGCVRAAIEYGWTPSPEDWRIREQEPHNSSLVGDLNAETFKPAPFPKDCAGL